MKGPAMTDNLERETGLKACPLCGKCPGTVSGQVAEHEPKYYLVWCDECLAEGPPRDTPDEAIAAWNHRPAVEAEVVEAARELLAARFETFKARNGRMVGVQDDSGEKVWLAPFDEMAALEHALTSSAPASAWRDMVSAPKDGSIILVYRPDGSI